MFGGQHHYSPVKQDFVWVAEYVDGTHLAEFDYETKKPNPLYAVSRDKLLRFGLIGNGASMYVEVYGGIFKILGQMLEVEYENNGKVYQLTNRAMMYTAVDTKKDVEFAFAPNELGSGKERIIQYRFGYSATFQVDGINMLFEIYCLIPSNQHAMLEIKLVPSEDMDGQIRIKRNGRDVDVIDAPMAKGAGGSITWTLR